MRIVLSVTALVVGTTVSLAAQSGELIHAAADRVPFTAEDSVRLIAAAFGTVSLDDVEKLSLQDVAALGYRVPADRPERAVTKKRFALLLAQWLDHLGGLRYALAVTPIAAFRELQREGLFAAWELPGEPLSGAEALEIVRSALGRARSAER